MHNMVVFKEVTSLDLKKESAGLSVSKSNHRSTENLSY